jgi:hypothetical protein
MNVMPAEAGIQQAAEISGFPLYAGMTKSSPL